MSLQGEKKTWTFKNENAFVYCCSLTMELLFCGCDSEILGAGLTCHVL